MNFLEKLNYLMNKNNLNKSTLSKACGIPYTTIDGWYKKGYEGLKLTTLNKLSDYFGTTLDFWTPKGERISHYVNAHSVGFEITARSLEHSPQIFEALCNGLVNSMSDRAPIFQNAEGAVLSISEFLKDHRISYMQKATALNSIIDFVIYDTQNNIVNIFYNSNNDLSEFVFQTKEENELDHIVKNCRKLNFTGLRKVSGYSADLSSISSYTEPEEEKDKQ